MWKRQRYEIENTFHHHLYPHREPGESNIQFWLAPSNVPHTLDTSEADGPVTILQLFTPARPADSIKKIIESPD